MKMSGNEINNFPTFLPQFTTFGNFQLQNYSSFNSIYPAITQTLILPSRDNFFCRNGLKVGENSFNPILSTLSFPN